MHLRSDPSANGLNTCGWLEELAPTALPSLGLSAQLSFLSTRLPQATMKDKSHGRDEADCRAELILINGDCADPADDTATLVLEANGKPDTPGESRCSVPGMLCAQGCPVPRMPHAQDAPCPGCSMPGMPRARDAPCLGCSVPGMPRA